jgi:hypothetical protein
MRRCSRVLIGVEEGKVDAVVSLRGPVRKGGWSRRLAPRVVLMIPHDLNVLIIPLDDS